MNDDDLPEISLSKEECKEILASIALADHVGDCMDAVRVIARKLGMDDSVNMDTLHEHDLLPKHLKESRNDK